MKLYPKDALERFEFDKIKSELKKYCQSEPAINMAEGLVPVSNSEQLEQTLAQTKELYQIVSNALVFPEIGFPPLSNELKWLKIKGSRLEGESFLRILTAASIMRNVLKFLRTNRAIYPALFKIVETTNDPKPLIFQIEQTIDENGQVRSSASKKLGEIRKLLYSEKVKAKKKFDGIIRRYKKLGWLRDFDESYYNNRRVLAVEAEYKRKIKGIIHGISETGKSAFIEPIEMIDINNQVAGLEQEEIIEINRILLALTASVAIYLPDILHYNQSLGLLDFTRAKVKLALEMDARLPEINQNGEIKLVNAFHPILSRFLKLENKKVIPLSLSLDKETRIMVISGPNAGGKSIALKTMVLLQIMLQSGLCILVKEDSKMRIFDQIFVDIGDDQSIEYELSTYSSRLIKMKHFLRAADRDTLVFIDEFGTGSDPDLGGALAEVMLQDLMKSKPYGMITTHYNNIKVFAENNKGIINGSMLFERKSLKPLYELEVGQPGSSFTFEVASKIGLSNDLIDRAKHVVDNQKVSFDRVLVQLQARKNELNRKNNQLAKNQRQLSQELEKNREQFKKLNEKLDALKDKDNQKLMEQGRKYLRLLVHWQKNKSKKELLKRIIIASEKMKESEKKEKIKDELHQLREKKERRKTQKVNRRKQKSVKGQVEWNPEPGDTVKIGKGRQTGTLMELDLHKGKGVVHFGMMKTIVDIDKIVVVVKGNSNG